MFKRLLKNRKGAALVEYGLLVGGIALISAGAVSLFGHKTSDMIGTVAAIVPGAHGDDNGPIVSGKLIETTAAGTEPIGVDFGTIATKAGQNRLGQNVGGGDGATIATLVVEPTPAP